MALGTSVVVRRQDHRDYKWLATWREGGKRKRKYFKTKEGEGGAIPWARNKEAELVSTGADRSISDEERSAILLRRSELDEVGLGLADAIDFAIQHRRSLNLSCSIEKLVADYIASKERAGRSDGHLVDLRARLGRFADDNGAKPVASIPPKEIETWLYGLRHTRGESKSKPMSPATLKAYLGRLVPLFNYAIKHGYRPDNPAKMIDPPKVVKEKVGILTIPEARRLLSACRDDTLPVIALGLFAGLRDSEIKRLDWSEIDLGEGHIEITAAKSKTTMERFVPIEENLAAYLLPLARPAGSVFPSNGRKLLLEVRETAEIDGWPHNALRHSYASYWLAEHEDAPALQMRLGQRSASVLFDHYRRRVKAKDAEEFWKIQPKDGHTIPLPVAS